MRETLSNLVESYGYVAVFVLIALESLGIPLPGESALVSAAAFAASGRLSLPWLLFVAAAAAIMGDNGGYWIGRKGGPLILKRYGDVLHIDESKIERARKFFERHGAKTVFIGRFIALLRTWTALLAGVGQMRYGTFMLYNALGGITWAVIFGELGYIFGRNLPRLEHYVGQATLAFVLLAVLIVALFLGGSWFRTNAARLSAQIARAAGRLASSPRLQQLRTRHPLAWQFLVRRFEPGEYLGLHLTIGLVISIGALWLFGGVTEDVIHHDPLTQFDLMLLEWFHAHSTTEGVHIFAAISYLASPLVVIALGAIIAIRLTVKRSWILFAGWVAALVGACVLDELLKQIIRRPRPSYAAALLHGYSFSFPSGHAMASLVTYGMLAYLLAVFRAKRRKLRVVIVTAAALLVLAIGISRLYLGVHYFSDVVGGYAAGALWLSTCITGIEIARRQPAVQA